MSDTKNITDPNYSVYSINSFFGIGIPIRLVILIYIFLSFILNLIIVITILTTKRAKYSISFLITGSILFVNFIHTASYLFEWVIQSDDISYKVPIEEITEDTDIENSNLNQNKIEYITVGGLLIGNINNFGWCTAQSILLVSSSMSQDILINIFYYICNMPRHPNNLKVILVLLLLGVGFPTGFALFYYYFDILGINEQFCYVKLFKTHVTGNYVDYNLFGDVDNFIILIYLIRLINFIICWRLFYRILKYIRSAKLNMIYILKSSPFLVIQLFTILIGIVYHVLFTFFKTSKNLYIFSYIYLILTTVDGILFPIAYSLSNDIYTSLWKKIKGELTKEEEDDDSIDYFLNESDQSGQSSQNGKIQ